MSLLEMRRTIGSLGDSKSCVTFLMPIKYPSDNEELTGRYIILELWGESEVAVYI